jgi:hypothetical protein
MSRRSVWYEDMKRTGLISCRISGLNLTEEKFVQKRLFFKKQVVVQQTIFYIEISIRNYKWITNRTFQEFFEFYNIVKQDPRVHHFKYKLKVNRFLYSAYLILQIEIHYFNLINIFNKAPFPKGKDGESDVMILVERKEMLDQFLKEIVTQIDFELYEPLNSFIDAKNKWINVKNKIKIICKAIRRYQIKKKLNMVF